MDWQTIVSIGLTAIGSPVLVKFVEHLLEARKGRIKSKRTEVERAQLQAANYRRKAKIYRHSLYLMDEAFHKLRVVAINYQVPDEKIPPRPELPLTDDMNYELDD